MGSAIKVLVDAVDDFGQVPGTIVVRVSDEVTARVDVDDLVAALSDLESGRPILSSDGLVSIEPSIVGGIVVLSLRAEISERPAVGSVTLATTDLDAALSATWLRLCDASRRAAALHARVERSAVNGSLLATAALADSTARVQVSVGGAAAKIVHICATEA